MFLRCCIIHFDCRILFFHNWTPHFENFIIAVDLVDIKTTFLVDCQQFIQKNCMRNQLVLWFIVRSYNIVHRSFWADTLLSLLSTCP